MTSPTYNPSFLHLRDAIQQIIIGQESLIERLMIAILVDGHMLIEGVPGLAKTKTLSALTRALSAKMSRIQFTPDLLPADLIGTEVYRPQTGEFVVRKGPIFANLLLADEINRAPAKVQSALLQAMQEREVTIGEDTFPLPEPFLVLATQNPIEQEGTYPLPEAQLDRFLMKLLVTYPPPSDELAILRAGERRVTSIEPILSLNDIRALKQELERVYIDERIDRYIVEITCATRTVERFGLKGMVDWGASPRAGLALRSSARALAFIRGRDFVSPDLVKELASDVFRHRILLSFEGEARGVTCDDVVKALLVAIPVP